MNDDRYAPFGEGPRACPFVAFEDDRDRRGDRPDYRHRCFAAAQPEPRAFPHQERYCLSPAFTECPIFLEWARREAAVATPARRPAAAQTAPGLVEDEDAEPVSDETAASVDAVPASAAAAAAAGAVSSAARPGPAESDVPPFLAGRPRPAQSPEVLHTAPPRTPNVDEGLWGPEAEQRRRGPAPVTGTARANANANRPAWEPPSRIESYPRIRERHGSSARMPLILAALAVLALMAGLFVAPIIIGNRNTNNGGGGGGGNPTASVTPSSKASVTPSSPTPQPKPTPIQYRIKSGDSLFAIAAKYGVTIEDILAANPQIKNPDQIAEGQLITIPVPGAGASPSPSQ